MSPDNHSDGIDFQQYWMTLRRQWLPTVITFGFIVSLGAIATLLQKPIYQGQGKLLIKVDSLSRLTGIGSSNDLQINATNSLNNEVEAIRSVPLAERTIRVLDLKDESGEPLSVRKFLKRLDVKAIRGTDAISVSYRGSGSQEVVAVVNQLIQIYLERNRLVNRAETIAAREFIEKQLPETKVGVQQASEKLAEFKRRNLFLTVDDEAKSFSIVLQELEKKIDETRGALANSQARTMSLKKRLNMEPDRAVTLGSLSQSAGVQKTLEELQNVQNQLAIGQARFKDDAPTIRNLQEKEANLRKLLKERIEQSAGGQNISQSENLQIGKLREDLIGDFVKVESERLGFENQLSALTNQYTFHRKRAVAIADLEQAQRQLQLNLNAAQSTYEVLLKNLQEVKIAENQNIGNAQIIESAIPPEKPVAPNKLLNLLASSVIGLILGIIAAFIVDKKDSTIKTGQEATNILNYTLLGLVPDFNKIRAYSPKNSARILSEIPVHDDPQSFISETYRTLFTTLQFLQPDKKLTVIAIISSVAGEGKSTIAANLALAASEVCGRTLLIDADMRQPSQHKLFKLPNNLGLSGVLAEHIEIQKLIYQVQRLDILTSGVVPSNPVVLLKSQTMKTLIKVLAESYDFVVIDTPPLLVGADASVIGNMVDGILLIVRPGVVPKQSALHAQKLLEQSKHTVLGQVLNAVTPNGEQISYFGFDKSSHNGNVSLKQP